MEIPRFGFTERVSAHSHDGVAGCVLKRKQTSPLSFLCAPHFTRFCLVSLSLVESISNSKTFPTGTFGILKGGKTRQSFQRAPNPQPPQSPNHPLNLQTSEPPNLRTSNPQPSTPVVPPRLPIEAKERREAAAILKTATAELEPVEAPDSLGSLGACEATREPVRFAAAGINQPTGALCCQSTIDTIGSRRVLHQW